MLSISAPSTPETRGSINAAALAKLPRGAIVVNTARGDLVNDDDLIAALKSGQVGYAGLDVYKGEPNIHPGYYELENVFLLPHMGTSASRRATRWASPRSTISTPCSPAGSRHPLSFNHAPKQTCL